MLNEPVLKLLENIDGRILSSQLKETTGISEKTWKSEAISSKTLEKASKNEKDFLINNFRKAGNSEDEIKVFFDGYPRYKSPLYSGLFYRCEAEGVMRFPRAIQLAGKIDNLSSDLYDAKYSNNIEAFKEILLDKFYNDNCAWLLEDYHKDYASNIESVKYWSELESDLDKLKIFTAISLFAYWDIEFCTQYFKSYRLRPLFSLVLPKLDPVVNKKNSKRRDMYWQPVRRLINIMSCMDEFLKNEKWPNEIPTVSEYALKIGYPEQKLVKWRAGEHNFTIKNFNSLWVISCRNNGKSDMHLSPSPLFVAAKLWEILLPNIKKIKLDGFQVIENLYYRHWEWHMKKFKSERSKCKEKEWPGCLDKI